MGPSLLGKQVSSTNSAVRPQHLILPRAKPIIQSQVKLSLAHETKTQELVKSGLGGFFVCIHREQYSFAW